MMIDIEKIERLELKPGEVLHVKAGVRLTSNQTNAAYSTFRSLFPNNKVFISDQASDISLEAIKA